MFHFQIWSRGINLFHDLSCDQLQDASPPRAMDHLEFIRENVHSPDGLFPANLISLNYQP